MSDDHATDIYSLINVHLDFRPESEPPTLALTLTDVTEQILSQVWLTNRRFDDDEVQSAAAHVLLTLIEGAFSLAKAEAKETDSALKKVQDAANEAIRLIKRVINEAEKDTDMRSISATPEQAQVAVYVSPEADDDFL